MRIWGWKRVKLPKISKTSNRIVEKTILKGFSKSRFSAIFGIFTLWEPLVGHYKAICGVDLLFCKSHNTRSWRHVLPQTTKRGNPYKVMVPHNASGTPRGTQGLSVWTMLPQRKYPQNRIFDFWAVLHPKGKGSILGDWDAYLRLETC